MSEPPTSSGPKFGLLIVVVVILGAVVWGMFAAGVFDDSDSGPSTEAAFGGRDAGRLVERLDAASKAQNICYGWVIDSGRAGSAFTPPVPAGQQQGAPAARPGVQTGSNLGVGTDPRQRTDQCPNWVVFTADYTYSGTDGEWTSVIPEVKTNLPVSVSSADLAQAGISTQDLLGDNANARLADAIGALPMIVSAKSGAPAVPEAAGQPPPAGDKATAPGKARYVWIGLAVVLVISGLAWIVIAAVRSRSSDA